MTQMYGHDERGYRDMQPRTEGEGATPSGQLPLVSCSMSVDAKGGLARVVLVQRFENPHAEPLSMHYKLPLPQDAAVSDFGFTIGTKVVQGVVQKKAEARATYERALADGRTGALLEQESSSLFSQELGNVPGGESVEVRVVLDQPLLWIADANAQGSWEWRFPLAAAPRYLGGPELGAGSPHFSAASTPARASLELTVRDALTQSPESPTHLLTHSGASTLFAGDPPSAGAAPRSGLDDGNRAPLDRDVAIRWSVATSSFETTIDARGDGARAFALLTVVPPTHARAPRSVPRDLTLLLDTSGSMQGEPLEQEKRMALALIDALSATDSLEVIEFSSHTRAFSRTPVAATATAKAEASRWVGALHASGGTEMVSGVEAAMRELRTESQRQIVLITDGLVGFERQIVSAVLQRLPARARLHCVGVGSAVNRSLVAPIARAGRGTFAIVGLGEDAERAAARVIAHTSAPLAVDLDISGSGVLRTMPARLPDVFANAPLRLAVELNPNGGELVVRGRSADGPFVQRVQCPRLEAGEGNAAIAKLFGREQVEELEMQLSGGGPQRELDLEIERIGLDFQIASRLTSWVAVTEQRTVDPRDPTRQVVQPHALPYGMSAEGLGLRPAAPVLRSLGAIPAAGAPMAMPRAASRLRRESVTDGPTPVPPAQATGAPPPPPAPAPSSGGAPPVPARAKKSLPERAADFVRRAFDDESKDGGTSMQARITFEDDVQTLLELVSPGFEFDPLRAHCTITLTDGTQLAATLVLDSSTRAGFVGTGLRVRILLQHPSRGGVALASVTVVLGSPSGTFEVTATP